MHSNLPPAPRCYAVQRPLTFEARKATLHGLSLPSENPKSWSCISPSLCFFMARIRINHRRGMILFLDAFPQLCTAVASIRHQIGRIKPTIGESRFAQHISSPLRIMNVPRADVSSHRKFGFAVYQEMQLVAVSVFLDALGAVFSRPSCVGVK